MNIFNAIIVFQAVIKYIINGKKYKYIDLFANINKDSAANKEHIGSAILSQKRACETIEENIIILKAGEQPVPNDATIIFFIRIAFCRETKYVRLLRNLELFP